MTKRGLIGWMGVALISFPVGFGVLARVQQDCTNHRNNEVDVPLTGGAQSFVVPVHVGWPVLLHMKRQISIGVRANGSGLESPAGCMLGLHSIVSTSTGCAGKPTLHLRFRFEDRAGEVVSGYGGVPMEGVYPDPGRDDPPIYDTELLADFALDQDLPGGDYKLRVSEVEVPPELASALPRLEVEELWLASAPFDDPIFGAGAFLVGLVGLLLLLSVGIWWVVDLKRDMNRARR